MKKILAVLSILSLFQFVSFLAGGNFLYHYSGLEYLGNLFYYVEMEYGLGIFVCVIIPITIFLWGYYFLSKIKKLKIPGFLQSKFKYILVILTVTSGLYVPSFLLSYSPISDISSLLSSLLNWSIPLTIFLWCYYFLNEIINKIKRILFSAGTAVAITLLPFIITYIFTPYFDYAVLYKSIPRFCKYINDEHVFSKICQISEGNGE